MGLFEVRNDRMSRSGSDMLSQDPGELVPNGEPTCKTVGAVNRTTSAKGFT